MIPFNHYFTALIKAAGFRGPLYPTASLLSPLSSGVPLLKHLCTTHFRVRAVAAECYSSLNEVAKQTNMNV